MHSLCLRVIAVGVAVVSGIGLLAAQPTDCSSGCASARYWRVPQLPRDLTTLTDNERRPPFPEDAYLNETDETKQVGLAFSGGGTRSAAATLGQLRGLKKNGWLEHVTYISAISGGAWAAVPFTFTKRSLDEFLGTYEDPGTLVKQNVEAIDNGRLSRAIAHSGLLAAGLPEGAAIGAEGYAKNHSNALLTNAIGLTNRLRRESDRLDKTFARLLAGIFVDGKKGDELIEPGTTNAARLFSLDNGTADEMSRTAPSSDFVVAAAHRPYLIATGTMVSARSDYPYPLLIPVEYTPLYVGTRQIFGGFGGSYIWPWAYDPVALGTPTTDQANDVIPVRVDQAHKFTLADVVASTGAAPELAAILGPAMLPEKYQGKAQLAAKVFPAFRHVSVQQGKTVTLSGSMPHADGGAEDNLGIMPLLARHVRNILVFVNTDTPFAENNDDLQSLFAAAHPPGLTGDKRHNVVFEQRLHQTVIDGLTKARVDRKPQVFCDSGWKVLPNERFGILPYAGLNICFVYNASIPQWEEEFRNNQEVLTVAKNIRNFPWFSTFEQDKPNVIKLSTAEVNLLSNLTAWTLRHTETAMLIQQHIPPFPPAPQ